MLEAQRAPMRADSAEISNDKSSTEDKQEQKSEDTAVGETREARVARTSSGNEHHNTLTPHWDFAFSV